MSGCAVLNTFIGVDLGWYGKPSGLASLAQDGSGLRLCSTDRIQGASEIVDWICAQALAGNAVVGVDAPIVIPNRAGIRDAERALNRDFRRFHAGCHAANLGRPFAENVVSFSRSLERVGFRHGANMRAREQGRFQIEVHPHAASVNLFGLDRIVKYKRGTRDARASELHRLRELMLTRLPLMEPALSLQLPEVPDAGNIKPVEDRIDAVLCAWIAAHWWFWGLSRNSLYGTQETGYIVVPHGARGPA